MKTKIFCVMVLCAGMLIGCDKEEEYEPSKPPIEKPDKPITPPSTDDIINLKIGDINMIVGKNRWNSVAYGNGKYVAVGGDYKGLSGYVTSSTDGTNWSTPVSIENKPSAGLLDYLVSIAYGNGIFVAVGDMAGWGANFARYTTSANGITWGVCSSLNIGQNLSGATEIIFVNGKFVFITSTEFLTSTNGSTWTYIGKFPNTAFSIAYGNGKYVIGGNGYIFTSTDGAAWTTFNVPYNGYSTNYFYGATYGNGKFVLLTGGGRVFTSVDGNTWTEHSQLVLPNDYCEYRRVKFINGKFIAVGGTAYKSVGMYACSSDGVNWKTIEMGTNILNDICAFQ